MGDVGAPMPGELRVERADLAAHIQGLPGPRALIAITGAPGAGKSHLARELASALQARYPGGTAIVQMDAFHYDDAILQARGLQHRKGAPETFDVAGLAHLLGRLSAEAPEEIAIPVFDRTLELSRAGAAIVPAKARYILIEGNYLLLTRAPWRDLARFFDLSIRLDTPEPLRRTRLHRRWHDQNLAGDEIARRIDTNDLPNGRIVAQESRAADLLVHDPG